MQKCGYCGLENEASSIRCSECGLALRDEPPLISDPSDELFSGPVSGAVKLALWLTAWGAVPFFIEPKLWLTTPLFPLGLSICLVWFDLSYYNFLAGAFVPLGWALYVSLAVAAGRVRKVGSFLLLYLILCALLALNVVGCRTMLSLPKMSL